MQGYTPTRSGLLLMPAGFVLAMVFPLAGHFGDRLPPWLPVMAGLALFGLSNWLCGGADVDTPFWSLAMWIVMGRVGLGADYAGAERRRVARALPQRSWRKARGR